MKYLLLLTALFFCSCIQYSEGDRTGQVVKFSRKGLVCKTWEGEMILGTPGGGSSESNYWSFTLDENEPIDLLLVPDIQAALVSGKRVEMHYRQEFAPLCRSYGDNYFVKSVKVMP